MVEPQPTRFDPPRSASTPHPEDWLAHGLLSGFVAIVAMGAALAAISGLANAIGDSGGSRIERWLYFLNHNRISDRAGDRVFVAIALTLVVGLLLALLYSRIEDLFPLRRGYEKGLVFGFVLWLVAIFIALPIMHGGVFGMDLHAGPLPAILTFIVCLIYGAVLGAVGAVRVDSWVTPTPEDRDAALDLERDTTLGLIAGAIVGVVAGGLLQNSLDNIVAGGFTVVALALVGAAFGALLGSFMTEDHHGGGSPRGHH